jgi:formiminoglutamase
VILIVQRYPFLISIPHGGIEVPLEVRNLLALNEDELLYYCDPETRTLFNFRDRVIAFIDAPVSRMVIDLNRPPLPLPPKDSDGIIKVRTIDGKEVYQLGKLPDMQHIHQLLVKYYFPYHQEVDELIDQHPVKVAFDCHSMLPYGSSKQKDVGKHRPLICLGNNGDRYGRAKKGNVATCSVVWIHYLVKAFQEQFSLESEVAINNPFSGGFISNAHYWRKGIPWIQIEVNRALYEPEGGGGEVNRKRIESLREQIWQALTTFWKYVS